MTKFQPLVSCIVPVYNAEKYLDQGVTSLLNQTYNNLEILLIDDCSTDGSWGICQKYAKQHERIRIYQTKKNTGSPLRGRQMGIEKASGEWITFMDGDDYVLPQYVEHLVDGLQDGAFDISVTGHSRLHIDGTIEDFNWKDYTRTTAERLAEFYHDYLIRDYWNNPANTLGQNLIKASICKTANLSKYSSFVYGEDALMALTFLAGSQNGVHFADHHDFIWRQVAGSGSHGGFSSRTDEAEFHAACQTLFHAPHIYDAISAQLPQISVIIPAYNVEAYLEECLTSVISQTYRQLEIIIVDDGSTDHTDNIIKKFAKSDSRIVPIKQKNAGLNMARAKGVNTARGAYITFIDGDDRVHPHFVRSMYESLVMHDVDIAAYGMGYFSTTSDVEAMTEQSNDFIVGSDQVIKSKRDALRYYLNDITSVLNIHQMTACGKLYRTEIVAETDWRMSNYRRHEDNFETLQWYAKANRGISASSEMLYYYRINPASITNTRSLNVDPEGNEIDYFTYLRRLYDTMVAVIDDSSLAVAILNSFAHTNRIQTHTFFEKDQLDKTDMKISNDNADFIIQAYNTQLAERDATISRQAEQLQAFHTSTSWKVTKPLRAIKKRLQK